MLSLRLLIVVLAMPVIAAGQGRAPRRPNLEGIWNSATVTPIERPANLKDKPFFTPEEAAAFERAYAERNAEPTPEQAAKSKGTGTYKGKVGAKEPYYEEGREQIEY